ncbi:MAG: glutamate racemase [Hyphomicrobiales bacterium]|nr:glutamate racemase [Hyphomicrobiales bacterium]
MIEDAHHGRAPRLLIFDSGLGGLTVARAIREAAPEARMSYVADDAGFPYGALDETAIEARVLRIMGEALDPMRPDAVVIACNTASTIALAALRNAHPHTPFIGTVPAVKPAAAMSRSGLISVLATPATVNREYTRALIAEHGRGCAFTLVGSHRLAPLAERHMMGERVSDEVILSEISPCFVTAEDGRRTDVIVLACTHYPLLMDRLDRLAPWPVAWLDPAPAIARRAANLLSEMGFIVGVGAQRPRGDIHFTSGALPAAPALALIGSYGLGLRGAAGARDETAHYETPWGGVESLQEPERR